MRLSRIVTTGLAICVAFAGLARADDRPARTWLDYIENLPVIEPVIDFLSPQTALEMPVYPYNGAVTAQNPPVFHWRFDAPDTSYEVEIESPDGRTLRRLTPWNHLLLDRTLPAGAYRWRARAWPAGRPAGEFGAWRQFSIHPQAHAFVAPPMSELWQRALDRQRPRTFPGKQEFGELRRELNQGSRKDLFKETRRIVEEKWIGDELTPDPPVATFEVEDYYERIRVARFIASETNREVVRTSTIAYTWFLTRDPASREEAWRRVDNLMAWDPDHATSVRSSDLSNLRIALALALVYDITAKDMPEDRKTRLRRMIEYRTQAAFDEYVVNPRRAMELKPYNSHGFRQAGAVSAIAALMAGDSPRAQNWFNRTWPIYLAVNNPWGGDDGGFGNGVNYGVWDALNNMQYWDVIRTAIDVDPIRMGWPQQAGIFFSYFVPPGTPNSSFGDGGENVLPDVWALIAQMYRQRVDTPISRRFAAQWEEPQREEFFLHLYGPLYEPEAKPFRQENYVDLPDTAIFPSIGWVVMHSELDDPDRYSILFKSSSYGSFSHSHADQNSFIINGRGQSLAIDSGYYDTWKSAHHSQWTWHTRAHNAITYDGGKGQPPQERAAVGEIVNFARCDGYDMAVGDATAAYMGDLDKARRTIVYMRPDRALIYDRLSSPTPRTWEWNLHSWSEIARPAPDRMEIASGDGRVCFTVLAAPDNTVSQTDRFPADPDPFFVPDWKPQWHLTVASSDRLPAAEFLVLADLGCTGATADAVTPMPDGGFELQVDGMRVRIDDRSGAAVPTGPRAAAPACAVPPKSDVVAHRRAIPAGSSGETSVD